jgi:DNA-binding CsgD family transcriptional regulator
MRQTGGPARSREGYHWFRGWRKPTAAQRRVLDELVAGGTNAQIAARLGISEDGVKWHLSELRDETGLGDRRELAAWWEEERKRPAVNLLLPFTALWRFASQNTAAPAVVAGVLAASLAAGWLAYDSLRGDDDGAVSSAAPVETPERAAAAPFVPTPTPSPVPAGALVFDVASGEGTILPGDFTARQWLDTQAMTFTTLSSKPTVVDAEGNASPLSQRTGVQTIPDTDKHRVVIWDAGRGLLELLDTESLEVLLSGDFGPPISRSSRRGSVSPAAGKVAIMDEPYDAVTIYDLDASNPRRIFEAKQDERVLFVDWSRDGEWLLVDAITEDDGGVSEERSLLYGADGTLAFEYPVRANWVGARALRLFMQDAGGRSVPDEVIDLTHQGHIPLPDETLLCVSPDGRYAVTGEPQSTAFNAPADHHLVDLVSGEVVSSATVTRFLVSCDWTPDGSKVVLSAGGK